MHDGFSPTRVGVAVVIGRGEVRYAICSDSNSQIAVHGSEIDALKNEVKSWRAFVTKVAAGVVTAMILGVVAVLGLK